MKLGPRLDAHMFLFERNIWLTFLPHPEEQHSEWRKQPYLTIKVDRHRGGTCGPDYLSLRSDVRLIPDLKPQGEHGLGLSSCRAIWAVDIADLGEGKGPSGSHWYSCWCCSDSEPFLMVAPF